MATLLGVSLSSTRDGAVASVTPVVVGLVFVRRSTLKDPAATTRCSPLVNRGVSVTPAASFAGAASRDGYGASGATRRSRATVATRAVARVALAPAGRRMGWRLGDAPDSDATLHGGCAQR